MNGDPINPADLRSHLASVLANIKKSATSALEAMHRPTDADNAEKSLTLLKLAAEAEKLEAEVDKAKHEARKIEVDASLASRQLRLSFLSAMTSQLVPLAALLTVAVTFYGSYQQSQQVRILEAAKVAADQAAQERLAWETFKGDFDRVSADDLYKRPTFVARLKAFVASGKHSSEVFDISRPLLGDLTSKSAFVEIWANTYKTVNSDNFANVIYIARTQRNRWFKIMQDCSIIPIPPNTSLSDNDAQGWGMGPCFTGYRRNDVLQAYADKPELTKKIMELREQVIGTDSIIPFLSDAISAYLREDAKTGVKQYDLSEITFSGSKLDGLDFSKSNLNQSRFFRTSVAGAILTGERSQMTNEFQETAWWEAAAIEESVLRDLITYAYPGSSTQRFYAVWSSLTEDVYRRHIARLCTSRAVWCDKTCVRFGPSTEPLTETCTSRN
jgi:hypothetical protein